MLVLGEAVRARDELVSRPCRICSQGITMVVGQGVSFCAGSGQFEPETCATACWEGALTVCTILSECTATCPAPCPAV
jgi:hypothetical protein